MQGDNQSAKGFGAGVPRALEAAYWNIRNLFTEGVTREGLRDLFQRDARETFRFFTRNIDFAAIFTWPPLLSG